MEVKINFKEIIFPTPKEVIQSTDTITPIKGFNVTYLTSALQEQLAFYFPRDKFPEANYTLVISYAADILGYILELGDKEIKIRAKDNENIIYALITLRFLTQYNDQLVKMTITDWADIKRRGIVEGFYGFPWTQEERLDLICSMARYKFNEYVYAPKDDRYHRLDWRLLYPKKELTNLAALISAAHKHNVTFTWALHPGDSINLDSGRDFNDVLCKLEQLYSIGVRRFGIFFDDITKNIDYQAQVNFINKVDNNFIKAKQDCLPLLVVATRYCNAWGPSIEEYFAYYLHKLNSDIDIMWTGQNTTSGVTPAAFTHPLAIAKSDRPLAIWWNYPVNDYCDRKLLVAPVTNLAPINNISAFYANPMHQAQASKVALISIANYTWNQKDYDPQKAWEKATAVLAGDKANILRSIFAHMGYLDQKINAEERFTFHESHTLAQLLGEITTLALNKENIAEKATLLEKEVSLILQNINNLKLIKNRPLVQEVEPFAGALTALFNALLAALTYAKDNKRHDALLKTYFWLNQKARFTINKLKPKDKDNPVNGDNIVVKYACEVGAEYLLPLINLLINY